MKRNGTARYRVYLSHSAHERAVKRKKESGQRLRLKNKETVAYVKDKAGEEVVRSNERCRNRQTTESA
ncbi:hypothetical protein H8E50_09165 [bacterium]|nr:hypothetical protein [bacterium]